MKKSVFSKLLAVTLCLILAFSAFSVNVFAIDEDADIDMGDDVIISKLNEVWLSSEGNDSNAGNSESAAFKTLEKATYKVANGGTIHISGSYSVDSSNVWTAKRPNANFTVTGGTLSLSADLVIGSNVTFQNITISGGKKLYANGKTVTFGSGTTASAVTVYGGNKTGEALESTNVIVDGGTLGTVYGGSSTSCTINQVNLTVNSGTVTNIFGGNSAGNLTGNVTVDIKGGTINSSIFGGCYNAFSGGSFISSAKWSSSYYVTGNIDVILRDGATLSMSSDDRSIFAHSRGALQSTEVTNIIFLSESFYSSTSGKLAAHSSASGSWGSKTINDMMGTSVSNSADYVHVHSVTADDTNDTITEGCTLKAPSNTASPCKATVVTLALNNKASLKYTGGAITPMVATVNGELSFDEPVITYSNNVNPGVAKATMKYAGLSVSKEFTIAKADQIAPTLTAVNESISGKADGEILGLSTAMEISTDNATFTPVTDINAKFAAGTYYVRYTETEYKNASAATMVVIAAGEKLSVTFVADGKTVDTKYVSYGANLTDIPNIPAKTGYDKVTPYWDVTDFTNITADITVNAVYTINTYVVKYVADGVVVSEQTVNYGEDAVAPEIPAKEGYTETAPYWNAEAIKVTSDLTINAVYTKDLPKITPADTNNDGSVNLKDLITIARYVAGWENTDAYLPALDIDGDNDIDLDDVNTLAQYLAGWNVEISKVPYLGK